MSNHKDGRPHSREGQDAAWYSANCQEFLREDEKSVVAGMASSAAAQGWHIEPQQHQEWHASVGMLQEELRQLVSVDAAAMQSSVREGGVDGYTGIVLEFDFRRRGLRIDCVLLAPGAIVVLEFKRSRLTPASADQVANYCVNLVEFHEESRGVCQGEACIVVPVLVQTEGTYDGAATGQGEFHGEPWGCVLREPVRCDRSSFGHALQRALELRRGCCDLDRKAWISSRFSPSSTILDAAISLFGQHDVSAIHEHAGSIEQVESTLGEVASHAKEALSTRKNRIIFVSGAPGAGKTLVGLRLAFDPRFREDAVFVTGNAPLVEVLTEALKRSYRKATARSVARISGYPRESARLVIENAMFKIVKAHHFLGERGKKTSSADGRFVIFDEAQRTYEKGRQVLGRPLKDHEADLILASLERSYPDGAVVVALLGHNQAIGRGERGAVAWLEASERRGWDYSISEQSLNLAELAAGERWRSHPRRLPLESGHLANSLRFYRNKEVEAWVHSLMEDDQDRALELSRQLAREGHQVWLTRDLAVARRWAWSRRIGDERAGLIASGQARRLAAEGLWVGQKPPVAHWMLAPSGDIRSSNMLESVQNQFQIQGLELDYTVVCWDADLRRSVDGWAAWKISGGSWREDRALDVVKNSYRVLLTRARKGMIVFVPRGDLTSYDQSREPSFYDGIFEHLRAYGAQLWAEESAD